MPLILDGTNGISDVRSTTDGSAATPAIRGTDTNTGIFFPAADTIAFGEGGAEVMRINSSGQVGVGTSTPLSTLGVKASGAHGIVLDTDGADSTASTRLFGKNATSTGCIFHYDNSGNPIWCITSGSTVGSSTGTTRLTISQYGLALGNYDAATSGTGIKFPVAHNASSDPNTLDDYEEGTWTPTFTNGGTATYNTRSGRYTKIGRLVTLFFHIDVNVVGTASGVVSITGFPFTSISTGDIYGHGGMPHCQSFSAAKSGVHILVPVGATSGDVYQDSGNGAGQLTWATLGSGNMLGSLVYESNS